MNHAFEVSGVGLSTQQRALDVIASNIANINTPAFKRSDVRFSAMIVGAIDPAAPSADLTAPHFLSGVRADAILALDETGELDQTGRALDIAIGGPGFIELLGPNGQRLLWRGGPLSVGEDGALMGAGLPLAAMISVPEGAVIEIGADGVVRVRREDEHATAEIGRIMLVKAADARALEHLDGGLYRAAEGATVQEYAPGEAGMGELVQGAIERSNVDINDEMIRLLVVQRAYAANAQIVQAADQLMAIANSLRR